MKKIIVSLMVALYATTSFAQSSLLATLSHDGNITSYYGINALKEAYSASVNGDVITLSSGQFNAVDIAKAITIRGAGHDTNVEEGRQPTVLTGDFKIAAPNEETSSRLILEGLYHNFEMSYNTINGVQFIKCRFNDVNPANSNSTISCSFIQCRIMDQLYLSENSNATCINSYISKPTCQNSTSTFQFDNCVIYTSSTITSSLLSNCIILPNSNGISIYSSSMAYNCIAVGTVGDYFKNVPNNTNQNITGYAMFETFTGTRNDDADFTLTEEAKAKYIGTDGTEVGIYGGALPYETTPNNPQITKFKVASKSTADGKLSVDITVAIPE